MSSTSTSIGWDCSQELSEQDSRRVISYCVQDLFEGLEVYGETPRLAACYFWVRQDGSTTVKVGSSPYMRSRGS